MRHSAKARLISQVSVALFLIIFFSGLVCSEEKPEVYVQLGHIFTSNAVSFSPDGRSAISGGDDQTLKLWDAIEGKEIKRFIGHKGLVSSVSFSPDGRYVLSGSWDQTLKLWDVDTGREIRIFAGHTGFVSAVVFSPNGRYALSGSYDKTLKLWDVDTGREIKEFAGHSDYVTAAAFSPDGRYILSGSRDKTLILWHVETGEELKTFSGHTSHVDSTAFSPDGSFVISASSDRTLKLWDIKAGREVRTYKGHLNRVISVSISRDGLSILSGGSEGVMMLWNLKSGKRIMTFKGKAEGVKTVTFSPDGRHALSGGNRLILWDLASGKEIRTFTGQPASDESALMTPYNRYTSSGSVHSIHKMLDILTGRELAMRVNFTGGDWIMVTPDGYFDSSPGGAKNLKVRIANHAYGIDQFYNRFYHPDMVKLALAGKELFEPEEDFLQIALGKPAPTVDIISPQSGSVFDTNSVHISVNITSNRGGIGSVYAYLNGAQVANKRQSNIPTGEKISQRLSFSVPLVQGENNISVIAFNSDDSMASVPASLTVSSKVVKGEPQVHALIVGINQYENEWLSLKYAVSDAEAFAETLKKCTEPLFRNANIKVLTSSEETSKNNIKKSFDKIKNVIKANDVFVFYMASHGLIDVADDEQTYYLLTSNVRFFSPYQIGKQALSQEDIISLVGSIPAQNKLVILDTCHAADAANEISIERLRRNRGFIESTAIRRLQRTIGSAVFASLSDMRVAFQGYNKQGLFTSILNQGLLANTVADKDGIITVSSLANYVQTEMPRISKGALKKAYIPITEFSTNFPVAKIR